MPDTTEKQPRFSKSSLDKFNKLTPQEQEAVLKVLAKTWARAGRKMRESKS
jgi:hypothetical protein